MGTNSDTEIRAVIDLGRSYTHLKIAEINPKSNKLVKMLFQQSVAVPYQQQLLIAKNKNLNPSIIEHGIRTIQQMKETANLYKANKIIVVASHVLGTAANIQDFSNKIKQKTGLGLKVITKDESPQIILEAALSLTSVAKENAVLWYLGQSEDETKLITLDKNKQLKVDYDKDLTAIIFKDYITKNIQKKTPAVSSPNPMSAEDISKALDFVKQNASKLPSIFKEKIGDKNNSVIAYGKLFQYYIKDLVLGFPADNGSTPKIITRKQVEVFLGQLKGQDDANLSQSVELYPEIVVSNVIIVLGFMQELGIEQIEVIELNETYASLFSADFN